MSHRFANLLRPDNYGKAHHFWTDFITALKQIAQSPNMDNEKKKLFVTYVWLVLAST